MTSRSARQPGDARVDRVHRERRDGERDEQAAGEQRREQRALEDAVEDRAPDARLAAASCGAASPTHGTRPFSIQPLRDRNASIAGSTVTEPSTATATTMIVPMPNETKTALPARNMPAIAAITVKPETSTARPEVAAAAFKRGLPAAPGVAFLHLAA